jgi:hypothetical protein
MPIYILYIDIGRSHIDIEYFLIIKCLIALAQSYSINIYRRPLRHGKIYDSPVAHMPIPVTALRRRSAAAWLLGSRVRIPLGAWMFVCCVYMLCCPV